MTTNNQTEENMPRLSIALSTEARNKLEELSKKHLRSLSKEVEFLILDCKE